MLYLSAFAKKYGCNLLFRFAISFLFSFSLSYYSTPQLDGGELGNFRFNGG